MSQCKCMSCEMERQERSRKAQEEFMEMQRKYWQEKPLFERLAEMPPCTKNPPAPKPAPLRVLEVKIDEARRYLSDDGSYETYGKLDLVQEFPPSFAGKKVRVVVEEV